jgi:Tol biopolymer transport system component
VRNDIYALWSPDAKRIFFGSDRSGVFNVFEKPASGVGEERRVVQSTDDMTPYSLTRDGRFLFYRLNVSNTGVLSLTGTPALRPLLQAGFTQNLAQVSPDGRWIAYQSNESGTYEVYVLRFRRTRSS